VGLESDLNVKIIADSLFQWIQRTDVAALSF